MFKNLLNPNNSLMITMSWITDCIFLSLFWIIGCFPVVTAGASFAALYDATFRTFRRGEKNNWQRFLKVYRDNWKGGILPTVAVMALGWALLRLMIKAWNGAALGNLSMMAFSGVAFLGILALGILSVVFPMLSRFDNSVAGLLKNSLLLAFANLPRTIGLGLVNAAAIFLWIRFVVPLFFLPALAALIGSLFIEPMFKPYMPDEEAAE